MRGSHLGVVQVSTVNLSHCPEARQKRCKVHRQVTGGKAMELMDENICTHAGKAWWHPWTPELLQAQCAALTNLEETLGARLIGIKEAHELVHRNLHQSLWVLRICDVGVDELQAVVQVGGLAVQRSQRFVSACHVQDLWVVELLHPGHLLGVIAVITNVDDNARARGPVCALRGQDGTLNDGE
jgi:hypothetical protein